MEPNSKKSGGAMALCWAASQGNMAELRRLVADGYDLNEGDYDNRTAMHLAASEGQAEVLRYLIAKGVNINPRDRWGGTPLADALREGQKEVGALLRRAGATE
jgi:glutaminase